jgi:hypothetical protein
MIDAIDSATSHTGDSAVLDRDVQRASVRAEHAGRLDPSIDVFAGQAASEILIDPRRPSCASGERGPDAPWFGNAVGHMRPPLRRSHLLDTDPAQDVRLVSGFVQNRIELCMDHAITKGTPYSSIEWPLIWHEMCSRGARGTV